MPLIREAFYIYICRLLRHFIEITGSWYSRPRWAAYVELQVSQLKTVADNFCFLEKIYCGFFFWDSNTKRACIVKVEPELVWGMGLCGNWILWKCRGQTASCAKYVRHFTVALRHSRDGRNENAFLFSATEIWHDHFSNTNASRLWVEEIIKQRSHCKPILVVAFFICMMV